MGNFGRLNNNYNQINQDSIPKVKSTNILQSPINNNTPVGNYDPSLRKTRQLAKMNYQNETFEVPLKEGGKDELVNN